ncbi:hypothetical protein chiPu_0010731 [Chiloscyllium punctatum]|uniref:Uncharacterized protein n=1 Tax=Chiloscyllium punctatum TaxID=137246 RepID=A0A401SPG1_CHIPU|nr:hypothetical protein [Chiloscyllium punctatum]
MDPMTDIQDIMPVLQRQKPPNRKDRKIAVVDVTMRYENDSKALKMAWHEKSNKYKHLNAEIKEQTEVQNPTLWLRDGCMRQVAGHE